jgi:uncharacterized protein YbcI
MDDSSAVGHTQPRVATRDDRGQVLLDLSNAIVRIHKQFYGKGPTKARSHLSHNLLTVILEGGFTRSEQTLLEHGHVAEVTLGRAALQDSVESELRGAVESVLKRRVRSFMSANDPDCGLQAEIFVLEPVADGDGEVDPGLAERARRAREQHREILEEHRALRAEQVQSRRGTRPDRHFEP